MHESEPSPTIDVLGLGAVAVDDLLYVDRYPEAESKTRVRRRERQCGGQTGTALVAAARFGVRASYGGLLGEDALSGQVVTNFKQEGVDTRWASISSRARPAHSTIIVDRKARTRTVFASVEGDLGAASSGPGKAVLAASRVLLIDHHGIEGNLRAAKIARRNHRAVVADFERNAGPGFENLLGLVDHLIVSSRFASQWTGRTDPAEAAKELAAKQRPLTAVTAGSSGCFYCTGSEPGKIHHQSAFPVEVVDTTGCGDVFHGVYAAALSQLAKPRQCLRLAAAAAALKAAHHGGQSGIPRRDAIERFAAERS